MNFKGRDFAMCLIKFDEFKSLKKADTVLYRVCKKKLLHFWRYRDYLFSPRYNLPYISWQQISLRRGQLKNKSGFQDF